MARWLEKLPPITGPWFALLSVLLFGLRALADYVCSQAHHWFAFGRWRLLHWPDYFAFASSFVSDDWQFRLLTWAIWPGYLVLQAVVVLMRLQTLHLPKRWVLFLLVPAVNIIFLLLLMFEHMSEARDFLARRHTRSGSPLPLASTGNKAEAGSATGESSRQQQPTAGQAAATKTTSVGSSPWPSRSQLWKAECAKDDLLGAVILTVLILVPLGLLLVYLSADLSEQYGITLFVLGPFVAGWLTATIMHKASGESLGDCMLSFLLVMFLGAALLFAVGAEGLVCLLMASPLVLAVGLAGCVCGYLVARSTRFSGYSRWSAGLLVVAWPIGLATEVTWPPQPELHAVETEIIVKAPVEVVWQVTISFDQLPEVTEELFRLGVAYPVAAKINGQGVGAVRHCIFNTGTFVEPIRVWQPPYLLRFDVTDQPPPMNELSPWPIHPPHLDGCLVCRQGEFRLEPLGPNQTRLIGTTWYVLHMWPEWYWHLWSDYCIHQIHSRVLRHIRHLAETHASVAADSAGP